MQVAEDFTSA
uniref:Uncharacterized protein n=1 Tax=Arundo donax TaxID=35708 RepID=A0A0A9AAR7_ARUDO